MASCSFTHNGRTFTLSVWETNYSIANNTSDIAWELNISGGGGTWYDSYAKATVNGNVVFNETKAWSTGAFPARDGSVSGNITGIGHNNEGKKTISFALEGYSYSYSTQSANGSLTLTNIPRKATIIEHSQSFNDEQNPYFKYSNLANATLSCWLEINPNGEHLATRTLSGTGGTYTWELTETERNQLRAKITNSNNATCRIGLYSTISGTTYNDYKDIPFSIVNANPNTSNLLLEVYDSNSTTVALTGNSDVMVKGYSTLHVKKWTNATAQKYATMKEYKVENVVQAYSENTQNFEIANYSKNSFNFYSIDSRNNSTQTTNPCPWFVDYFNITKNSMSLIRSQGGVGEEVTLSFSGTFWNGNFGDFQDLQTTGTDNVDNLSVTYRYKKTSASSWTTGTTTITPTISNNDYSFSGVIAGDTTQHGFDIDDSYDVEVIISDSLSTATFSTILGAGKPGLAFYGNKVSLGDKYDTSLGGTQLWGDIYINGNSIDPYSTNEIDTGKRWTDGRKIYKKVVDCGYLPNTSSKEVDPSISNLDQLTEPIRGFTYTSNSSDSFPLPYISTAGSTYYIDLAFSNGKIRLRTSTDRSSLGAYVILEYVKTTS